jgi:hypothetical protein
LKPRHRTISVNVNAHNEHIWVVKTSGARPASGAILTSSIGYRTATSMGLRRRRQRLERPLKTGAKLTAALY